MTGLAADNLIRVFDFYLATAALLSFARRYPVYWDVARLAVGLPGRPKLLDRVRTHAGVLVTRDVVRPAALAVGLMAIQVVCSRLIWPTAVLPLGVVAGSPWRLAVVLAAAVPMLAVDGYFLLRVGRIDRGATEQYLDLAERWLTGWKAPAVRAATLGYVDPQRIVDDEVRKGLTTLGGMVRWSMWWVSAQVTCRVLFGLTVWLVWAAG